jgi:hypothetical protein
LSFFSAYSLFSLFLSNSAVHLATLSVMTQPLQEIDPLRTRKPQAGCNKG